MEKLEEMYLRWVMRLDSRTPKYIVREEMRKGKLRERAGRRAWRFERRLREGREGELARNCLGEMKKRMAKRKEISG